MLMLYGRGKISCGLLLAIVTLLLWALPAGAVNWIYLQAVEEPQAAKLRFGGFVLFDYQAAGGGTLAAGPFQGQPMLSGRVAPSLRSASEFNLRKLHLGVRGALSETLGYSLKTISGNNSASVLDENDRIRLVEASVTINAVPGARLRLGMFKTPGAEETLGFIPPCHYINLSTMTNMLLQERFFAADGSDPRQANEPPAAGCCRDIGIMVFDAFGVGRWELSYAAMLANGHGIQWRDENSNPDLYLHAAAEWLRGRGQNLYRQGWKFFGWYQEGQRTLEVGSSHQRHAYRRCRYGIGSALLWDRFRLEGELVKADGMIFVGSDGQSIPGSLSNNGQLVSSYNVFPEDQALGWYADFGYRLRSNWWLNGRYDRLDLGTETNFMRVFKTWTLAMNYHFSKKLRAKISYEWRSASAPRQPSVSSTNQILDQMNNRAAVQLLYLF